MDQKKVVRGYEDELVSLLCKENGKELCDKFYEESLLSKESYDNFNSLDHSRLKPELQVRYLLRLVTCSKEVTTNQDIHVGENLIDFLNTMESVPSSLIDELQQAMTIPNTDLTDDSDTVGGVSATAMGGDMEEPDIALTPNDVSLLTEWLTPASHKWVEIAISLGLREHEIANSKGENNIISLFRIIAYWINNSNATLRKLTDTLSSDTVGYKTLSEEVKGKSKELTRPCKKREIIHSPEKSTQTLRIKLSLCRGVADGKSTLLQVQAKPKQCVSYQWNKDGQPLPKNSRRYSGVDENILFIRRACQGSEGEYTCRVSLQEKQVTRTSNPINLTVHFPPAKEHLLNRYSELKEVPNYRTDWPPAVANKFIKLAIIKSTARNTKSGTVQGSADDIIAEKEKIEYDEVFGEYKSRELILVKGRPGSGKTTLVHKVIKDWASGKALANATLTILLTLRLLNLDSENETLTAVLQSLYSYEKLAELAEVRDGEGVCFALDGLDEFRPQNKQKSVVMKLLDRKYLPRSMIIVFSRPSTIEQLQKDLITKRIEVFGFDEKHISEYIDNFPFDEVGMSDSSVTRASQLKEYLVDNPNIHDMCYLPIHAAMICFLFKFAENISSTQTKMYDEFTRLIIQRHLTRHEECQELVSLKDLKYEYATRFENLCLLAYEMTIKSKQVVSSQEVQAQLGGSGHLSEEEGLGLLTICPTLYQTGFHENYAFLHLSIQEFLTAYYLANYLDEKHHDDLVLKYSHMDKVWRFYISLIDFAKALNKIVDLFIIKKDWKALYLCQCAFDLQKQIVCDEVFIRNSGSLSFDNVQTPADILAIDYVIASSSLSLTELSIRTYEHDDERIISLFSHLQERDLKQLKNLWFGTLFDNGTASLCEVVKSATNIAFLVLTIKHTCSCNATKLASQINYCTKLKSLYLSYSGTAECIQSFVTSLNPSVRECFLPLDKLDSQSIQALGIGLQHSNYSNHLTLTVTHSDINDIGMTCLADGLRNIKSLELDLSDNNIGSNGITPLAERLDTLHLKSLNLSHNNIGSDGAAALAGKITCLTELNRLNLSHNNIGSDGAAALAGKITCLTELNWLNLSHNNIGSDGAAVLAGSITCSTELNRLNLSHNNIGSDGAAALAGSKTCLTELHHLDISHNNISSDGAAALAGSITCLTELHWLNLSHNNIGPEGAVALAEGANYLTKLDRCVLSDNNIDVAAAKAVISTLKECSTLIINCTSDSDYSLMWKLSNEIVVEGLVSPDDTATISGLVEAAQHETKTKKLNLGFKTIQVPPKNPIYQAWSNSIISAWNIQ